MSELDEILEHLVIGERLSGDGNVLERTIEIWKDGNITNAKQAINAYILGEVMELLGEDEPNRPLLQMRNELRQELRNKANEKFGGK